MRRLLRQRRRARLGIAGRPGGSVDRGDTLIELMVAIAIIGISAAAILGGLAAALGSSGTHRTLTNLDAIVRSFVETAKYQIQDQSGSQSWVLNGTPTYGPMFAACASTGPAVSGASTAVYPVTSAPYPTSGPVNSLVTVFGSGFFDAAHLSVTFAPVDSPTQPLPAFIKQKSIVNGYLTVTFFVPNVAGVDLIKITDGSTTVYAGGNFTVPGPGNTSGLATSMSQYQVGISAIQYLNTTNPSSPSSSSTFTSDQATCQGDTNRADQVQMLTATATAPDGERDQLNFTVADPGFIPPPTTLTLSVAPSPAQAGNPGLATQGNTLTFTADLTPTRAPAPTGSITWTWVKAPWLPAPPPTPPCSTPSPLPPAAPLQVTCQVPDAQAGDYELGATYYPGVGSPYAGTAAVPVTIHVWAPTQLQFTSQPSTGVDGQPLSNIQVQVSDVNGDLENSNNDKIMLALQGSPPGSLTCPAGATQPAINGVATFSGCYIIGSAVPPNNLYTLTATDTSEPLTSATSAPITLSLGPAYQLAFTTQPPASATDGGATWSFKVSIEDVGGNTITTNTDSITVSVAPPSPAGALTCSNKTRKANKGTATFSGCNITGSTAAPSNPYTLKATDSTKPPPQVMNATSDPITLGVGPAYQLAFTAQPTSLTDGMAWTSAVQVSVQDVGGNAIPGNTDSITLNPQPGLSCAGSMTQLAANGVASFSGCSITGSTASPYTLTATDGTDTSLTATSNSITLIEGHASQLTFTAQPTSLTDGVAWTSAVQVSVEDVGGNAITDNTDSITLNPQPGLSCTSMLTQPASDGVASFSGCSITGSTASPYTLTATDGTDTSLTATSNSITLTVGLASQLAFTTPPPENAGNGAPWPNPVQVSIQDVGGNTVTTSIDSIALSLLKPPANASLACTGATTQPASNGVATFPGCSITLQGGYTVTATDITDTTLPVVKATIFIGP